MTLPAIATRGREFAVARLSEVVRPKVIVGSYRGTVLAEAEQKAKAFDPRLQPTIILVERAKS